MSNTGGGGGGDATGKDAERERPSRDDSVHDDVTNHTWSPSVNVNALVFAMNVIE